MNLQTHIKDELWQAICNTYEAGNYSHAVLDAIRYLSDLLREKAGVDGDGVTLVGQALGGTVPRLKINKLQTETDRNIQKGFEDLLRGIYRAIRNPRSHEQIQDKQDDADAIICFVDYVVRTLDSSEARFSTARFIEAVFDPDFVETEEYARLLVEEIPEQKVLDTLIELYRVRKGRGAQLRYVGAEFYRRLGPEAWKDFMRVVSEDLRANQNDEQIRLAVLLIPPKQWPELDRIARIRIETKFIDSIEAGGIRYDDNYRGLLDGPHNYEPSGSFGTWSRSFLPYFSQKDRLRVVFTDKMSSDGDELAYLLKFFGGMLSQILTPKDWSGCLSDLCEKIVDGDGYISHVLAEGIDCIPLDWRLDIAQELKNRGYSHKILTGSDYEEEIPF